MTGDAVIVLKQLLTVTRLVADGRAVLVLGTAGVNLGGIENEGNTQCADNGLLIDGAVPEILLPSDRCGDAIITKSY